MSCLLGCCPAVCADVDSRLMPFPLRCPIGLLACRLVLAAWRWCSHLVRVGRVAMSLLTARRLVSFLASFIIPSVGSVLRLSPRLATRWAGRRADAVRLFVSRSILPLLACLGLFLAIHLIRMAAAVCGLSARRALLACPVVSVPCRSFRLGSRPLHPLARSIDAARCCCPDVMA